MPSLYNTSYLRLKDEDEFEELLRDICVLEWNDPRTERNGRRGQPQKGVDIYGQPAWLDGAFYGVQCKLRPSQKQLSKTEIMSEVKEARGFPHKLSKLIIATDTPKDNKLQIMVDNISAQEVSSGGFAVEIWFWPQIERRIGTYPSIFAKYYYEQIASLTNLDVLTRLIDRPLQVYSINYPFSPDVTPLELGLRFRGIQTIKHVTTPVEAKAVAYSDQLPDGLVCQIERIDETKEGIEQLRLVADLISLTRLLESSCPFVILAPLDQGERLLHQLEAMGGLSDRFLLLDSALRQDEISNQVFFTVFDYGYTRRSRIRTVNISTRTRPNSPASALLDIDWQSHLDTERHPSVQDWNELFVPALKVITTQLCGLKESTRLQIDCSLPLPASIALGFYFNLRVATIGVWARRMGRSETKYLWLSDGKPVETEIREIWHRRGASNSRSAILELTSGSSIHTTVEHFVQTQVLSADLWLEVNLPLNNNDTGIDEAVAIAYANWIGNRMREFTERGISDTHLFLRLPSALCVLIGQRLLACGRIHLYWFNNNRYSYQFAFTLA